MRVKGNKLFEPAPRERPCSISWVKGGRASEQEGGRKLAPDSYKVFCTQSVRGWSRFRSGASVPFRLHDLRTRLETLLSRFVLLTFLFAITSRHSHRHRFTSSELPFWCGLTRRARKNGTFVRHRRVDRHDRRSKCFLSFEGFLPNRRGWGEVRISSVTENHPLVGGDSYRGTSVVKHVPIVK